LMQHAGLPVKHKNLLQAIRHPRRGSGVEYLRAYIKRLRQKIENDAHHPEYLLTVRGFGYRFSGCPQPVNYTAAPEVAAVRGALAPALTSPELRAAKDTSGQISLHRLRAAIQRAEVSFPSQVLVFHRQSRADIQWRVVVLYFVRNWSCSALGQRYGVTMERVRQMLTQWVRRAMALGYLQEIPPAEALPESGAQAVLSGLPER
jgi:DNA-binding winged helix-turn-helix (wHTH) protein